MVCQHPINLGGQTFPCGRCVACKIQRTSQWTLRLMHELDYHNTSSFVTLTYDEAHVPDELKPKHLQDFFKRLRSHNVDRRIKYYACGEYGETFGRPHYHIIMYGIGVKEKEVIQDSWHFGFVKLGTVTPQSIRYVVSYIMDKEQSIAMSEFVGKKQPPFQRSSQGLGKQWLLENKEEVLKSLVIKSKGKELSLPKYYWNLIRDDVDDKTLDMIKVNKSEQRHDELERNGVAYFGLADYERELRQQKVEECKNINERRRMKKVKL